MGLHLANWHIFQWGMYDRGMNPIATDTDNGCMWAGMGMGKTVVGLTIAETLMRSREVKKTLVVSTKKAAEHTWAGEHIEWEHLEHQKEYTTLLFGNPQQRYKKLSRPGIHIINQENLPWLVAGFGVKNWPYDLVLIDDCKGFKKASAVTFTSLRHVRSKIKVLKFLNGTPMPNGYLQLWPQINTVDDGKRLGRTFGQYRDRFFIQLPNQRRFVLRDESCRTEIDNLLKDIAFSVDIDDYMEVPEALNPPPVLGYFPKKLREQYEELEDEFVLTLEDGEEVSALSAANLQNKLAQFCNGAVYTDPSNPSSPYSVIHDIKLDLLEEVIESSGGENLVVAYNFKSDMERIRKRFPHAVHVNDGSDTVSRWNAGEIPLLCCHPGSAGHGLNLQHGGRTIVWFGSEWSLELVQQMEERLGSVRQMQSGLNKNPRYIRLAIAGTVEQTIAQAVIEKGVTQDQLKEKVKLSLIR